MQPCLAVLALQVLASSIPPLISGSVLILMLVLVDAMPNPMLLVCVDYDACQR